MERERVCRMRKRKKAIRKFRISMRRKWRKKDKKFRGKQVENNEGGRRFK